MVVTIDSLSCLDYLIWLRSGAAAGKRLGLAQSSVSRSVSRVSEIFDIQLSKPNGEWEVSGDITLLNLERLVHQRYRWIHHLPLRIEAQYWSGPIFCDPLLDGWIKGNFDFLEVHTPLRLLQEGVIDALIGCYPDVPDEDDEDLICIHLTRMPAHLAVAPDHPLVALGEAITLDDARFFPSLALPDNAFPKVQAILQDLGLWNLLLDLQRYGKDWQSRSLEKFAVGYATVFTLHLFQSSRVILPLKIPLDVGDTLIVRRIFAEQPQLLELINHLKERARQLSQQFPEVGIP